jgi:glycosyltransferase involved in cell wall biosynthesis
MKLSIVMPAYNEAAGIVAAVEEVRRCVFSVVPNAELIVVDDGSTDDTRNTLGRLTTVERRLRLVHQANAGHGAAIVAGVQHATGEWLLLIDADQQIPLEDFAWYWKVALRHEAVFGVRRCRRDPGYRLAISALGRLVLRGYGVRVQDIGCAFKLLRREVWTAARIPANSTAPFLLLLAYAARAGLNTREIEVGYQDRTTGRRINLPRMLRYSWRSFVELWRHHATARE